jgi:translocation and assembly module TamB
MRRPLKWTLVAFLALLVLVVCGVLWIFNTQSGARFALNQATRFAGDGVRMEGVEGTVADLRIATIEVARPGMYALVQGFEMRASPLQPLRGLIHVEHLHAKSVEVRTVDSGEAARIPVSFAPPRPVRLDAGIVAELRMGELPAAAKDERDVAKIRAMAQAARGDKDLVIRGIFLRGEGDEREWRLGEARAETAYGKGSVSGRLETRPPFALDMKAALEGIAAERKYRADATARGTLKSVEAVAQAEVAGQRIDARVVLEPFATAAPVKSLDLRAKDFDLSRLAEAPRTRLALDVTLASEGKAFAGPVRIVNAEPGPWDQQKFPFTSANARVVLTPERVDVLDLAVALAGGGNASGRLALQKSGVQADLRVADVDLAALHGSLQKTRIAGRVAASGDRTAQKFELALKDPRFDVEGRAALASQKLTVDTVTIRTGGGSVVAAGGMDLAGRKAFRFEGRAQHFDPSAFVATTKGDLNFTFVALGTVEPLSGELNATIAPSTYAGMPASGRVLVAGDANRIARADVSLAIGDARVEAKGSYGGRGDALDVTLKAPNLAAVARPFKLELAGAASAQARLTGTLRAPAGRIELTGANLRLPGGVSLRELQLRGEAGSEPQSPIDVDVNAKGVVLSAEDPPTPFADAVQATLKGTRAAHRLEAEAQMTREIALRVALQGGLDPREKTPAWNGRIENLGMTGRGATFSQVAPTPLFASAARVEMGDLWLKGEWGEARMAMVKWTPRSLELRGSTPGLRIQQLARSFRFARMPRSDLVIAGDWDVRGAETFNALVNLRRVSGDLRVGEPPLPLGLQDMAVNLESNGGRLRATLVIAGDRIGRVSGEAAGLLARGKTGWQFAQDAPLQARLVAEHTNLEALSPWLGTDARLGGRINARVNVAGTGASPQVSGELRGVDLVVREPQSGFEMEQGQVALRMAGNVLTIERFNAVTPWNPPPAARENFKGLDMPASGTLSAEGTVDITRRTGNIRVRAQQAVLTQLRSRFLAVSGEAQVAAGTDGMDVRGVFKADAGWIGALDTPLPTVSEDVVVVRAAKPAAEEPKAGDKINIDARFALGDNVYFEGRGLDTRLTGEIHITGQPGAALRASGSIRTVGGTYRGYGQNLAIERGVIAFAGPLDNPRLNVLAVRKGLAVEAGVEVTGTTTRPRVRLVSSPDVPEPEKLSWLVLGRGPSELAPGDASVLLAAATSMLGKGGSGGDMAKRFGVDEVRIGRADSGSLLGVLPQSTVAGRTGSASAAEVVTIGKKITKDVHVSYEHTLAQAEGALKLTWQLTQRFQVLLRGGYLPGLDGVWRWTFK